MNISGTPQIIQISHVNTVNINLKIEPQKTCRNSECRNAKRTNYPRQAGHPELSPDRQSDQDNVNSGELEIRDVKAKESPDSSLEESENDEEDKGEGWEEKAVVEPLRMDALQLAQEFERLLPTLESEAEKVMGECIVLSFYHSTPYKMDENDITLIYVLHP